jgi:hypothetical protein
MFRLLVAGQENDHLLNTKPLAATQLEQTDSDSSIRL